MTRREESDFAAHTRARPGHPKRETARRLSLGSHRIHDWDNLKRVRFRRNHLCAGHMPNHSAMKQRMENRIQITKLVTNEFASILSIPCPIHHKKITTLDKCKKK